jgi:hypothetical protein
MAQTHIMHKIELMDIRPTLIAQAPTGISYHTVTSYSRRATEGFLIPLTVGEIEMLDPWWWRFCQGTPSINMGIGRYSSYTRSMYHCRTKKEFAKTLERVFENHDIAPRKIDQIRSWLRFPWLPSDELWSTLQEAIWDTDLSRFGITDFAIQPEPEPEWAFNDGPTRGGSSQWYIKNQKERHAESWVGCTFRLNEIEYIGVLTWMNQNRL